MGLGSPPSLSWILTSGGVGSRRAPARARGGPRSGCAAARPFTALLDLPPEQRAQAATTLGSVEVDPWPGRHRVRPPHPGPLRRRRLPHPGHPPPRHTRQQQSAIPERPTRRIHPHLNPRTAISMSLWCRSGCAAASIQQVREHQVDQLQRHRPSCRAGSNSEAEVNGCEHYFGHPHDERPKGWCGKAGPKHSKSVGQRARYGDAGKHRRITLTRVVQTPSMLSPSPSKKCHGPGHHRRIATTYGPGSTRKLRNTRVRAASAA